MTRVQLSKLHGTGNDFLVTTSVLDGRDAVTLCNRFTGIGADGILLLGAGGDSGAVPVPGAAADAADATMTLYNADGSVAEMSGNGARCLAWLARREGLGTPDRLVVDTGGGRRVVDLELDATGMVTRAICDMGPVTFAPAEIPIEGADAFDLAVDLDGVAARADAAGMGNPHLVILVDDPGTIDVVRHGARLERDRRFPRRVNVEFIHLRGPDTITMRVWERGVGETQSCGTGACAAAAVAHRRGLVGTHATVRVPGGELTVDMADTIRLGGPVVHVFDVEIDLDEWRNR